MHKLHEQLMNLPADGATLDWANTREAYMGGHRDARHAAAELAAPIDAELKALRKALAFYADPNRYHGPNQYAEVGDPYTKAGYPYRLDVTRDAGALARAALGDA